MTTYAANTKVPESRSKQEIEQTLARYGASAFGYGWDEGMAVITFRFADRMVKFELAVPTANWEVVRFTPKGRARTPAQRRDFVEQLTRQRWRALLLVVKAKMEAVESGIVSFEDEFLAHIILPDGSRVRDHTAPALEQAYSTGSMPALLPGG